MKGLGEAFRSAAVGRRRRFRGGGGWDVTLMLAPTSQPARDRRGHGKHAPARRDPAGQRTSNAQKTQHGRREKLTVEWVPQRTCSSRCWRCCEVRGRGGAEQSRSRRDGCSAGLSAAQKQAGRRLRGLTETGEACTARSAAREWALRVHSLDRPMSVSALERRWQFTARPQAIGWI